MIAASRVLRSALQLQRPAAAAAARAMSSVAVADLPVVDLEPFLRGELNAADQQAVADSLHTYSCLVVRDPRATEENNNTFLDMMERYFEQSDGVEDARPELHYQVGVTPAGREIARDHSEFAARMSPENKPLSPQPPPADPKWRFFWRIGEPPAQTQFQSLNADPVVPAAFAGEWEATMNMWGYKMRDACETVAQLAALGLELPQMSIKDRMANAPHLLAPTGSDYSTNHELNEALALLHTDLNLFTIHGKSRYPGLYIWLRDGTKVSVAVPDGCLLLQAGQQFEYITGGAIPAGFHEVVVNEATLAKIDERKAAGQSMWRVSSTLFSHIASDVELKPLGHFATEEAMAKYPPILTGQQVLNELQGIGLAK